MRRLTVGCHLAGIHCFGHELDPFCSMPVLSLSFAQSSRCCGLHLPLLLPRQLLIRQTESRLHLGTYLWRRQERLTLDELPVTLIQLAGAAHVVDLATENVVQLADLQEVKDVCLAESGH